MGYAVAISDDGNTIAAGVGDEACLTPGINPPGCADDTPALGGANIWVGAAYVFVRNAATWTEVSVTNHEGAGQIFARADRLADRGAGDSHPFVDPEGFTNWLEDLERNGEAKLEEERASENR